MEMLCRNLYTTSALIDCVWSLLAQTSKVFLNILVVSYILPENILALYYFISQEVILNANIISHRPT